MPVVVLLIELIFMALAVAFMLTQVFLPAVVNEPLFPFFRRRRKLEQKLTEARGDVADAKLRRDIDKTEELAGTAHASGHRK